MADISKLTLSFLNRNKLLEDKIFELSGGSAIKNGSGRVAAIWVGNVRQLPSGIAYVHLPDIFRSRFWETRYLEISIPVGGQVMVYHPDKTLVSGPIDAAQKYLTVSGSSLVYGLIPSSLKDEESPRIRISLY